MLFEPVSDTRTPFRLLECLRDCFLIQNVHIPTRFKDSQHSTVDLIITSEEHVSNLKMLTLLLKSDHVVLTIFAAALRRGIQLMSLATGFPKYNF